MAQSKSRTMMKETKVVFLGASEVGKSALVSGVIGGHFPEEHYPTVEDTYRKQYTYGAVTVHTEIVDTSGAQEFAAVTNFQMISGSAFAIVYSVNDRQTFQAAKQFLRDLCTMKTGDPRDRGSVPIVLVGNKSDRTAGRRQVTYEEGCSLAKLYGQTSVLETSALGGDNVQRIMSRLLESLFQSNSREKAPKKKSIVRRLSRKASNKWRKTIAL